MIFPTQEQLNLFKSTPGAISVHEMVAIINIAAQAPKGTCAEMGSHRGKSGIAAAIGLGHTDNHILHMVDPLYDMENLEAWSHADQKHPDNAWQGAKDQGFKAEVEWTIFAASNKNVETGDITPNLHGDYSTNAIPRLHSEHGDFGYVFIDSDQHQYELVKEECELLRNKMAIGGIICFHDFQSQFTGVERAYREMLEGGQYKEVPIDWEHIKAYVKDIGGEKGNTSWHHTDKEAPCFVGAIKKIR